MQDAAELEPVDPMRSPLLTKPLARGLLWTAGLGSLAALGLALFAASAAGWHGFVLLAGVAAAAFLLLYALAAGEAAGRALQERASRNEAPGPAKLAFEALEAIGEPVVVTDLKGGPRWGNAAYRDLAKRAGGFGQSFSLPGLDRLWVGARGGEGAIFRLARAAAAGKTRRERLPALPGVSGEVVYEVEARPAGAGHVVWLLRSAASSDGASVRPAAAPDWADRSPAALFALTPDGRIAEANDTLREWIGLKDGEALPDLKSMLAGEGARLILKTRGAAEISRVDARLSARDGVETPVAVAIRWDEGKTGLGRAVMYGLSTTGAPPGVAQAIAGAAGGRSAGRSFDEMFVSAPFGVARLDGADPESAMIEDANPALVQLCGGAAIPGVRFADLFDWSEGRDAAETFSAAASGRGEPAEAVLTGDPRREVHLVFAPSRGGKRSAYVIDVTAWKDLERQLSQGAKMQAVGQLAGGVAHDFNNLLQAIRLNADDLLGRHPVGDPSYGELQAINQNVVRGAGMIRKLLAFSRKQTFRVETLEVPDVLSDLSVLLRQILEESVRLDIVHGRGVPPIRADKGHLETALINLATNARDAMREKGGGTLSISTSLATADQVRAAGAPDPKDGDWVLVEVRDEGSGMDAATMEKIFEPFFTTKAAGQGTGLGLATVYGIVKQSGGFLFAESEPGKGAVFRIFLPGHHPTAEEKAGIVEARAAEVAPPPPADLAGRGRILLVEDEDAVRTIAAKTLVKRGYDVVEACDGEEALEIIMADAAGFDLMISDVEMPILNGPGLLEKARERLGGARVIFMSGYAQEQFSEMLSREKGVSFLPKPFTLTQLAEKVKAELGVAA